MTPEPQPEYIITEERLQELVYADIRTDEKEDLVEFVRSHPYVPAKSAEQVLEELRPSVLRFAHAMEQTLRKHDDRDGWEDCGFDWLLIRIREEYGEALDAYQKTNYPQSAAKEVVDIANFCMMFWDNAHPELCQQQEREQG